MPRLATFCLAALLAPAAALAAQDAPAAPVPPAKAELQADRPAVPEPQVLHEVTEDDHVRIDETRVRGQTQRLTVQPKIKGMPAYDIVPPEPGRAPAQDGKAGKRVLFTLGF